MEVLGGGAASYERGTPVCQGLYGGPRGGVLFLMSEVPPCSHPHHSTHHHLPHPSSTLTYRASALIRKHPPPWDPPRTLGIGLRYGLMEGLFLMSEVPL